MSIVQIGARLVRRFGEGKNLKKVVTETLNGKTFTRVLDIHGNTILDRAKKIDRYDVGNKKVSTITKVSKKSPDWLTKRITDRVYDGESKLLGTRRTDFKDLGDDYVTKFVKTSATKSSVAENRAIRKSFDTDNGLTIHRVFFTEDHSNYLYHNNKGLPIPRGTTLANMEDMSLAEMRRWHVLNNPDKPYAPAEFRLGYLDKQDDVLGTIHNLDQFF